VAVRDVAEVTIDCLLPALLSCALMLGFTWGAKRLTHRFVNFLLHGDSRCPDKTSEAGASNPSPDERSEISHDKALFLCLNITFFQLTRRPASISFIARRLTHVQLCRPEEGP
jgi:hypothetical protein